MKASSNNSAISFFKAARWLVLAILIFVIVAALRKPASPTAPLAAAQASENAKSFEAKLAQMQQASQQGEAGADTKFSADEVNSFIAEASARGATTPRASGSSTAASQNADDMPVKSAVVGFDNDQAIAQAVTQRYGQDIYLTLRGKVGASNGYLTFVPTEFQIGRMSVPVSLINSTLQSKLSDPENRSKLKLPEFIADLHVENGELVIKPK